MSSMLILEDLGVKFFEYTISHHYRVEVFFKIIDWQLQELNDRFNEVRTDLLIGVACLNPVDSFSSFDIKNILRMVNYIDDFGENVMVTLRNQLETYIVDVRDVDKRFSNLKGLGDLSEMLVKLERAFSAMKLIKSELRNRMDDDFLSSCMVPYVEKRIFNTIFDESIMNRFQEMKTRRIELNEAESIDKIINDNFQIMHHSVSATEKCLVGIESRMGEVESLFKVRSGDVCFVGIWGIGGIGKTTVARTFFDKISCQFQGSCFLANVREESKKHGLTYLQDTLLSRILNEKRMNIASFYEGADMIKRRLCHWKVLIVFDDVDDEHQLEYLVGNHDWFGEGSIIITTTRNQDLLRSHDQLYSVPELAKDEAIEVFSWHAFQKQTPDKEFLELSKSV
ncbi:hypothetical protein H5410_033050, partial [Solanum commersonii]